ncbi:hypothetical protein [Streptomyces roseolus]|uniref:hypothetical protein n=1 Tax=Streptomyces roseolus TaxID=67358 RepID=UPI0016754223|nr:hypothetical protein [Streptomyces roseolus]GGR35935.1 hypothetical protein GCM10010282_30430 [Streptomyces roseolus]
MTSSPRVTVPALGETVLRESPIFAALACPWLENGRFVPGTASRDRPSAVVSGTAILPTPVLAFPATVTPVAPELVPVPRGVRHVVPGVERP